MAPNSTPLDCPSCDSGRVHYGPGLGGIGHECSACSGTGHRRCNICHEPATRIAGDDVACDACGALVDADVAAYEDCEAGHPAARTTEAGWLALSAHPTRTMELVEGEVLGIRTCVHCRTSLSRVVASAEVAAYEAKRAAGAVR